MERAAPAAAAAAAGSIADNGSLLRMMRCMRRLQIVAALAALLSSTAAADEPIGAGAADDLSIVADRVADLVSAGTISQKQALALRKSLDAAWASLRAGRWAAAGWKLRGFDKQRGRLLRKGALGTADSDVLVGLTARIATSLDVRSDVRSAPAAACAPTTDPAFTVLYVSTHGLAIGADGSAKRPFRSLSDAVQKAYSDALPGVEIRIGPGAFHEGAFVTTPTRLVGAGRGRTLLHGQISGYGASVIDLSHLTLQALGGALGGPAGGVINDTPCSRTVLDDVEFRNSRGECVNVVDGTLEMTDVVCTAPLPDPYFPSAAIRIEDTDARLVRVRVRNAQGLGLDVLGGTLTASGLEISQTRALATDAAAGTAIRLRGGVRASLSLVTLDRNESAGIVAEGDGTKVLLRFVQVTRTTVNPLPAHRADLLLDGRFDGRGAVEVRDRALVLAEHFLIDRAESVGLLVHSGGLAHFRAGTISRVTSISDSDIAGICAAVVHAADLDQPPVGSDALDTPRAGLVLGDFVATRGSLCGLNASAAWLHARHGVVSNAVVGACVFGGRSGFTLDLAELADDVIYVDNGVNLQTSSGYPPPAPVPSGGVLALGGRTADPPPTFDVPFVCDWCE